MPKVVVVLPDPFPPMMARKPFSLATSQGLVQRSKIEETVPKTARI